MPVVEEHFQRGEVGVDQDVRGDDFGLQFGVLAEVARVLDAAVGPPM